MLSRFWLGIFVLLIAAAIGFAAYRLHSFNHFATIEDKFAGSCAPVTGIAGPEDIQIDRNARRAFISSLDRRAMRNEAAVRGAIFLVNIDDPLDRSGWRDRTGGTPTVFEPLGLHFYESEGVRRLFVVNGANNAVELFDVSSEGDLTHLETLSERRLTSLNDIVAVGPRSFYVTNDGEPSRYSLLSNLHFLSRTPSGSVFHYDEGRWRVAADGLRFANGINVSPDGSRLYVAETSGGAIKIFDRDIATNVLVVAETLTMGVAPSNINIDDNGALWIAALPKPLLLAAHRRDMKNRTPSSVYRYVDMQGQDQSGMLEEVYSGSGQAISAATTAAHFKGRLLIGTLLDKRYLLCNISG